jgi:hypothetical protein
MRFDEALAALDRAEKLYSAAGQPAHPALAVNRGAVLRSMGRAEEAMEQYELAATQAAEQGVPLHYTQHMNVAIVLTKMCKYDEAMARLEQAVALHGASGEPPDFRLPMNRGMILCALKRYEDSLDAYDESDRMAQEAGMEPMPLVPFHRAVSYVGLERFDDALASLAESVWRSGKMGSEVPEFVMQYERDLVRRLAQRESGRGGFGGGSGGRGGASRVSAAAPYVMPLPEEELLLPGEQPDGDGHDAFLSHRRREGHAYARLIKMNFEVRGRRAFLDIDEKAPTRRFDERLLSALDGSNNLVLILTPGALDRCVNDGDWLRREISYALQQDKNIIPVMMPDFKWPKADELPEDIRPLTLCEGLSYSHEYFPAFMDMLVNWCSVEAAAQA